MLNLRFDLIIWRLRIVMLIYKAKAVQDVGKNQHLCLNKAKIQKTKGSEFYGR